MLASTHSMLKIIDTAQGCKLQDMAWARCHANAGQKHLSCQPEMQLASLIEGARTPPRHVAPTHHMLDTSKLLVSLWASAACCLAC